MLITCPSTDVLHLCPAVSAYLRVRLGLGFGFESSAGEGFMHGSCYIVSELRMFGLCFKGLFEGADVCTGSTPVAERLDCPS